MTAIKYILKMILKLAALPVILILRVAMLTKIVGYPRYVDYMYSYPHKTAYRSFPSPVSLVPYLKQEMCIRDRL